MNYRNFKQRFEIKLEFRQKAMKNVYILLQMAIYVHGKL